MNRTIARLSALLVTGAWVGAACGGNVVVDASADAVSSSSTSGGATTSSTSGAGGGGTCDPASHTLAITDFDVSCTLTSECIPVFTGNFCSSCRCAFSAINVADIMKYDAEAQIEEAGAPQMVCKCPAAPPVCAQGKCVIQMG
jgi:hypothetical protein